MSPAKSSTSNIEPQDKLRYRKTIFNKWFGNLKVGHKIGLGYTVALGIAVIGSVTGVLIGDSFHQKAVYHEEDANEEFRLINTLNLELLQTHQHFLMFSAVLGSKDKLTENYALFIERKEKFQKQWKKFKDSEGGTDGEEEEEGELEAIENFLEEHGSVPEKYLKETERLLQEVNILYVEPRNKNAVKKKLLDFNDNQLVIDVNRLSDGLVVLSDRLEEEYNLAKSYTLEAYQLRRQIIFTGVIISILIAAILAMYISRTITYPLQSTTKIAKKVTQEANFDLQVPVLTTDEVGILSQSLNELISKVKQLLEEHQLINKNLDEKNIYLEKTLQELRSTQTRHFLTLN
ncbi:MAG: HAMP domain-containing protein [Cyanobacteria bacterium J06639_18]